MKELERIIIGCCFGEDQYKKVSFLEANDFTNYPGKPYREYFKLMEETGAKSDVFLKALSSCKNKELRSLLGEQAHVLGVCHPERYGLSLLTARFKTLFANLLVQLSNSTKNTVERELLNKAILSIDDVDVIDLSDGIMEYLGVQGSGNTKRRVTSFLEYRDKRINKAKKVIDGHKRIS
jgi:hypothetical protein